VLERLIQSPRGRWKRDLQTEAFNLERNEKRRQGDRQTDIDRKVETGVRDAMRGVLAPDCKSVSKRSVKGTLTD
jgi:hypothetical protein